MNFHLYDLLAEMAASGDRYHEFIRSPALSVGLYQLRAGTVDPQKPHGEDEVYYVISGMSKFTHKGVSQSVQPGSILFVGAGEEHHFHDIDEDLIALVLFAPPETSS